MSDPRKRVESLYAVLARDQSGKEWLVGAECPLGHPIFLITAAPERVEGMVETVRGKPQPVPATLRVVQFSRMVDMQVIEGGPPEGDS